VRLQGDIGVRFPALKGIQPLGQEVQALLFRVVPRKPDVGVGRMVEILVKSFEFGIGQIGDIRRVAA
jgi:hypothetical protein